MIRALPFLLPLTLPTSVLIAATTGPKAFGRLGMLLVAYPHFEVSHLLLHHRHACTPEDHSTAWLGESVYGYLRRTIPGCLIVTVCSAAALCAVSPLWLGVFLGQAVLAVLQLETVAYIEHYGLLRNAATARGPLPPECSWESRHRVSNDLTFNLQLHAAHHASGSRAFDELETRPAAPQLPAGYPQMIPIALIPPLWRRVIHPRLDAAIGAGTCS